MITPAHGIHVQFYGHPWYEIHNGDFQSWYEVGEGDFQVGGEKPSRDSPPTFICTEILFCHPLFHGQMCSSGPDRFCVLTVSTLYRDDFATAAFALISKRNDAIGANSTRGILSPIAVSFQAEVWSWVHDPNSSKHRLTSLVRTNAMTVILL
jgi:hypothetical protein